MTTIFGDDEEGFHRGFVAGMFWQKLRENRDRLVWAAPPSEVRLFTLMAQANGYRVQNKRDVRGWHQMTFTSTSGG
jgi:hypothetical protein